MHTAYKILLQQSCSF